ncbi:reprolysin-like metallopeptidase [Flavobacterium sp. J27]|uniref:zinc-dependent metalloprotease n=1 Tax=Flavobacterium sp. J27 TaxID=2060419 RepID=UPI00102F65E2|nr:zinc-dependent metalloprotease family protein [Flavobacterium sp. J27]
MKKLLLALFFLLFVSLSFSQIKEPWEKVSNKNITKNKLVERQSFPETFELIHLDLNAFKQLLKNVPDRYSRNADGVVITLPNAQGNLERFEIFEASNFDATLQAQFPEIRAYAGNGVDDVHATLRMSIDPMGIQTMVFRADKATEFMERFSEDGTIYAVYKSSRTKGKLPFTCSTNEQDFAKKLSKSNFSDADLNGRSSAGSLLNFRLALSCTAEYANYFGATSAANVGLVNAAYNATMTRVNGVFEKDFAIHMNIIANNNNVIYYNASTDPYSPASNLGNWNDELQSTLTSVIGEANYDVGHLFGATGGGGNAGCIGCVCVNNQKGSGYTSPADGIPAGDNFDIDYVAHELGHQFGANHTFTHGNEGSGVNVEVGSGVTIMGYAGITSYDTHQHSIDIFHSASIAQVQANMVGKTCPTSVAITHSAPVVNAGPDYTIPKSTPFVLTGSATDAGGASGLTYTWEEYDNATGNTGAASAASPTKTNGPNWVCYPATSVPQRHFPIINSTIANSQTTNGLEVISEALSSVARTLNFRLTARDNVAGQGQTGFDDTVISVNATAGPFLVTAPNTAVSWVAGSNQTVTWDVAGTTGNNVNASFVDIYLSNDGGFTYPILLASKVPNDGSEIVTVPNNVGSNKRVMVKGNNHVFYDISNANFSITAAPSTFSVAFSGVQNISSCNPTTATFTVDYAALGGFSGTTSFAATGAPAGATVSFSPNSVSANGTVTLTLGNLTGVAGGDYQILVNATSGGTTKTVPFYLSIGVSPVILTTPADNANGVNTTLTLNWNPSPSATSYDVQVATDAGFSNIVSSGNVTTNSYSASGLTQGTAYYWRVLPKNATCTGTFSSAYKFTTGTVSCGTVSSTNVPVAISASGAPTINSTLNIPSGGNISDINITMNVTHTYVSDLTATLISPSGTQVVLFANVCGSADNINVTFDDSGSALTCATSTPTLTGTRIPSQALSGFNGQSSTGTWTLRIADAYNLDGGSLNSWSLNICTVQPLASESFDLKDFSLYPNPNNGSFTVKFTSESSNNIEIGVYDISGRQVYNKSFSNTGNFNQNINLNNVQSGVYLVSIIDGSQKVVKRIIVE